MERYRIVMITHVGSTDNPNGKEFAIFDYHKANVVKFKGSRPNSIGFNAIDGDSEKAREYLFGLFEKETA